MIIEHTFPEDLEERLEALLSSVNTEPKQITLWASFDETLKTSTDLQKEFSRYVDASSYWVPDHRSFGEYSNKTFVPIGLVAEEKIKHEGAGKFNLTWRLTSAGLHYAQSIAAFTTKYAVDHNRSMFQYLGTTNSPSEHRSPYQRNKILELVADGFTREIDLIDKLEKGDIKRHLKTLSERRLIEYDSVTHEESGWAKYLWIEGKNLEEVKPVKPRHLRHTLTRDVAQVLSEIKEADYHEISQRLNYRHGSNISSILSGLVEQGFVQPMQFVGIKKKSDIRLTDKGKAFLNNYLIPVREALQDGKALEEMKVIFDQFNETSLGTEYAEKAMRLYQRVAPSLKREHNLIRENQILEIIIYYQKKHGFGPRQKELREKLDTNAVHYLRHLYKKGLVEKRREGSAVRYFIPKL